MPLNLLSYHVYPAPLPLGKDIPLKYVFKPIFFPLICLIWWSCFPTIVDLTFLVIYMIWAVIFSCLCKHLGVQLCQRDPVIFVGDISVTTDGRELCLLVRLVQRAGKWFSSSLALGTDIVADITDMLLSDMPCYRDRTRCQPPPFYF